VPFALPGERVLARPGALVELLEASPERVAPPCPHFFACGGCSLQHWDGAAYAAWKSGLLRNALQRAGFADPALAPLARTPPHARRRIDLAVRRSPGGVQIGLHRRKSHEIIDLATCVILHPDLFALIAPLRALLASLSALKREGSAVLNLLDAGPDLLLRLDGEPDAADRTRLAEFARTHGIPRIACAFRDFLPEPAAHLRPATIILAGTPVEPPPGAFLQASAEGEHAIVDAVLAGLPAKLPAKARVIELYAGSGTITFALAERARVLAVEGDAAALAALRRAATGKRIETMQRDLARQPLLAAELKSAAAVVLDPPHAGAAPQIGQIAAAVIPVIIYVSCNPAALARDAGALREAGYDLVQATPVDQFLWSARLESVAVFERRRKPGL
jgi:23S rRNA (uracil1939-C5)-methyltransferase